MRNEEIYELIGAIANAAIAYGGGRKLKLTDLAIILVLLDIESDENDYYINRTDFLIRNAYDYFTKKSDTKTADAIKKTYIKKNGEAVIQ